MPACLWRGHELVIELKVQPRAKTSEWLGMHGDSFRVRIQSPPVDGKANAALIVFLAQIFGVSQRNVRLLGGESSRNKRFAIVNPTTLPAGIERNASEN